MDWKKKVMGIPIAWLAIALILGTGASAAIYYGMSNTVEQTALVQRPVTLEIFNDPDWGETSSWEGTGREWTDYVSETAMAQELKMRNSVWDSATYAGYIEVNITGAGLVDGEIDAVYYWDELTYEACTLTYIDDHYIAKTATEKSFNGQNEPRYIYVFWNVGSYSEGSPYLATAVLTPT